MLSQPTKVIYILYHQHEKACFTCISSKVKSRQNSMAITHTDATYIKGSIQQLKSGWEPHQLQDYISCGERVPASASSWGPASLLHHASWRSIHGPDYICKNSSVPKPKCALVSFLEPSWLHWWSQIRILLKNYLILHFLQACCSTLIIWRPNWFFSLSPVASTAISIIRLWQHLQCMVCFALRKLQILNVAIIPSTRAESFNA